MILDRVRGHGRTSLRDCAHVTVVYSADLTAAEMNLDGEPDPIPTVPAGDDDTDESSEAGNSSGSPTGPVPAARENGSMQRVQSAPRVTGNLACLKAGSDTPSPSPLVAPPVDLRPQIQGEGARGDGVPLDACVNLPVWVSVGAPVRS